MEDHVHEALSEEEHAYPRCPDTETAREKAEQERTDGGGQHGERQCRRHGAVRQ